MPPSIHTTQNVLSFPQYTPWEFRPWATGRDETTSALWAIQANFDRRLPDAVVATTAALATSTYAPGTAGVGATLTLDSNGALSIDSYSVAVGDVVLVKNESSASRNGLYVVTDAGSVSTPWVLTRHTQMDSPAEFVGFVLVLNPGTTNKGKIFLCPPNPITVGTTPVVFAEWKNRWTSGPLPEGVTLNIATGRLYNASTIAGPGVIGLLASNDSGATWSEVANVVYNVMARPAPAHSGVDIDIDLTTRTATVGSEILTLTYGDDFLAYVRFLKGGTVVDLGVLEALKFGFKEGDEDDLVILGGGEDGDGESPPHFGRSGSGESAVYLFYCKIDGDDLKNAVENVSTAPAGTRPFADLDAEIEWVEGNSTGVGPTSLRRSTVPFTVRVYLDIVP